MIAKLSDTSSTNQSVAIAVEAARSAVDADVAYWYSKANGKVSGMSANCEYPPDRAAGLAKQLLARLPAGSETLRWVNPDAPTEKIPDAAVIATDARTQGCIVVTASPARRSRYSAASSPSRTPATR